MEVAGTGEQMTIHLHLLHESGARASVRLDDVQAKEILDFVDRTNKLFSQRQAGLPVKFWVTGSIAGNDKHSLESEAKYLKSK